jgi:hypothetical protein
MPSPTRHHVDASTQSTKDNMDPNSKNSRSSSSTSKLWLLVACGIVVYAVLQLDISRLSLSTNNVNAAKSVPKQKRKIRQISIIGERNSGTRWTYA